MPAPSVNAQQPDDRADRQHDGAGRARETDVRERVGGERRAAQHDEVADRAGHDGDDGARLEGVDHELVVEEQREVVEQVPAERGWCDVARMELSMRVADLLLEPDDEDPAAAVRQHLDRRRVDRATASPR